MIKIFVIAAKLSAILLVIITITVIVVDFNFSRSQPKTMYSGCFKVWAHRSNFEKSSNANESSKLKARGREIDIYYDPDSESYIVSHDYPYILRNERLLKLEEVFINTDIKGYYWLDFKNLKDLSISNTKTATKILRELLEEYSLIERTIIESKDLINLSVFSKNGFFTSYWIAPQEDRNMVAFWFNIYKYKIGFLYGEFSALSIDYNHYGSITEEVFSQMPIHIFTVNEKNILMELMAKENVKIILSDENYYLENSCGH